MAQQQNPHQTGSEEAGVKPFSIREYALACRQRNILNSWPFPDKYLHMCLNLGLTDLLPPFGPMASESHKSCSNLMMQYSQNDTNKGVPHNQLVEANQHNCSVSVNVAAAVDTLFSHRSSINHHRVREISPSPTMALSNEIILKDHKCRRRRGRRCKKRLMTDILATAPHRTLEEIIRMNKFFYSENAIEGCHQQLEPIENVSNLSETKGEAARECHDHEVVAANNNNIRMKGKGTLLLKFKLNGCNVNRNCGA